jgi:hypothetical protein
MLMMMMMMSMMMSMLNHPRLLFVRRKMHAWSLALATLQHRTFSLTIRTNNITHTYVDRVQRDVYDVIDDDRATRRRFAKHRRRCLTRRRYCSNRAHRMPKILSTILLQTPTLVRFVVGSVMQLDNVETDADLDSPALTTTLMALHQRYVRQVRASGGEMRRVAALRRRMLNLQQRAVGGSTWARAGPGVSTLLVRTFRRR